MDLQRQMSILVWIILGITSCTGTTGGPLGITYCYACTVVEGTSCTPQVENCRFKFSSQVTSCGVQHIPGSISVKIYGCFLTEMCGKEVINSAGTISCCPYNKCNNPDTFSIFTSTTVHPEDRGTEECYDCTFVDGTPCTPLVEMCSYVPATSCGVQHISGSISIKKYGCILTDMCGENIVNSAGSITTMCCHSNKCNHPDTFSSSEMVTGTMDEYHAGTDLYKGIGIGLAIMLAVILMLIGIFICVRRLRNKPAAGGDAVEKRTQPQHDVTRRKLPAVTKSSASHDTAYESMGAEYNHAYDHIRTFKTGQAGVEEGYLEPYD